MGLSFKVTNIGNLGRTIYLWHRVGRELKLFKDTSFYPYFYQEDINGIFKTIDNKKVKKIFCKQPYDIKKRRNENSYEADILFHKRYCIDKISQFIPCELKYSFIDIEVMCKELPNYLYPEQPISCISCSNSYTGEIKTFFLGEEPYSSTIYPGSGTENAEKQLLDDFIKWAKEQQFDLLLGWNFIDFDWRYLRARYKKIFGCELAEMLSPIAQSRYLGNSKKELEPNLIPVGLSVCDYLDFYKKIYKNESSYALDYVANKELKTLIRKKIDFNQLAEDIKIKNIEDVRLLMEIDKKKKIIEYYNQLRCMSMCDWNEVTWNSKIIDMILLKEAKQKGIILPSKHYGEGLEVDEIGFEGAYRRCETGLFKNLWELDLSSAYPQMIVDFCLDIANIKKNEGTIINNINFYQNNNTLLPTIARKMITKKDTLKIQLKTLSPESSEYKDLEIKYNAIKSVTNSLFGVCGLKIFRLFDYRIAGTITYLVRDLLHYIEDKLKKQNINVVYIDTDSLMLDTKENPKELCNQLVKQWAKEKYNKDNVNIAFDKKGIYEKIFVVALCHYKGYLRKKSGLEEVIRGIEAKRKDSSNFIREFQTNLIEKIMNEESQEEIIRFINDEKIRIKTLRLIDVGFPCRINSDKSYDSIPKFMRGLEYTKELIPTFDKRPGDAFYWIPTMPFGKAIRKSSRKKLNKESGEKERQTSEKEVNKDVLCYDEDNYNHIKPEMIDWNEIIRKSILEKCENIFNAMGWDLSLIKEVKPKRIKKEKQELTQKSQPTFTEDDFLKEKEENINKEEIQPYYSE